MCWHLLCSPEASVIAIQIRHRPRNKSNSPLAKGVLALIAFCAYLSETTGLRAQTSITLVQHLAKDAGSTNASTLAFPSPNTAGNWIAVAVRAGQINQTFTVNDTRGNTYRRAVQRNDTVDGTTLALYYAENVTSGSNTVSVADSIAGATLRFAVMEYSGVSLVNSLDVTASSQGTSALPSSGTTTTTSAGELILGVVATANPQSVTAGRGFTLSDALPAAPNTKLVTEYQRQNVAGSIAASASLSTADTWAALLAAFRPGSGSSSGPIITNLSPNSGAVGAPVTITGTGFASAQGTSSVRFGATVATPTSWSANSISAPVPAGATTCNVVVTVGGIASNGFAFTVTPTATDTQAPTAPGNLTAAPVGVNEIDLNWTAATDNVCVAAYRVEQCAGVGCSNFSEIATVNAGQATGPLTASPNPNYFRDASGTSIILNGSHTWNSFQDWGTNGSLQTVCQAERLNRIGDRTEVNLAVEVHG
jgi:hypothetical protein